jgi:hypothetical protein
MIRGVGDLGVNLSADQNDRAHQNVTAIIAPAVNASHQLRLKMR